MDIFLFLCGIGIVMGILIHGWPSINIHKHYHTDRKIYTVDAGNMSPEEVNTCIKELREGKTKGNVKDQSKAGERPITKPGLQPKIMEK